LKAKFETAKWPILGIADVMFINRPKLRKTDEWAPRVYENLIYLAPSMDKVNVQLQRSASSLRPFMGWERFTLFSTCIERYTFLARQTKIKGGNPTKPFTVVKLEDIYLGSDRCRRSTGGSPSTLETSPGLDTTYEDEIREVELTDNQDIVNNTYLRQFLVPVVEEREEFHQEFELTSRQKLIHVQATYPVDGRLSCALFFRCTETPTPYSLLCSYHLRTASRWLVEQKPSMPRQLPGPNTVKLRRPDNPRWLGELQYLQKLLSPTPPLITYIHDSEFHWFKGRAPSVFQYYLKRLGGNEIVNTNILYPESEFVISTAGDQIPSRFKQTFLRVYGNITISGGLTLAEVGKLIRQDGFSPETHCVVSWFSAADTITFHRAIRGERALLTPAKEEYKQLLSRSGKNCLQPINVGHMVKAFVELDSYSLSSVLQALVPESVHTDFHLAATDTLALEEIMLALVSKCVEAGLLKL
jgi:hypothetical protein